MVCVFESSVEVRYKAIKARWVWVTSCRRSGFQEAFLPCNEALLSSWIALQGPALSLRSYEKEDVVVEWRTNLCASISVCLSAIISFLSRSPSLWLPFGLHRLLLPNQGACLRAISGRCRLVQKSSLPCSNNCVSSIIGSEITMVGIIRGVDKAACLAPDTARPNLRSF